ncbi:SusC/RagA family TonB-linked outer membrane protein [Gynurincola endophyticus]|uniref:SusC/RagA family TonB-linked outer membrane protein n=1 Tax=Gynurincola endophyticus TaxID=2479004 RepID=UPI00131565E6|nr:SusC/RagA family TonB-linked outer membrane protein [Gynurincola endophyticus]
MKLVSFFLLISILQVSANTYAQKINLNEKNKTLIEVFSKIRQQADYDFIFTGSAIKGIGKISVYAKDEDILSVINKMFITLPIDYKIEGTTVILVRNDHKLPKVVAPSVEELAVIKEVRGRVVDVSGIPLQGATVKVSGKSIQTVTDSKGYFMLENVPDDAFLELSFVGYQPLKVKAAAAMGDLILQVEVGELNQVVLNAGYYSVRDKEKTGNITKVSAEIIERQPVINVLGALQGRVAGLDIVETGGMAGNMVQVNLRGRNSIAGGTDPLYIIDGVPFSSESLGDFQVSRQLAMGSYGVLSTLNTLNGNDIESIEVLKDADATAIYGSRGANGVILISTKKGKAGKTKFDFSLNAGINKPTMGTEMLNTQEYIAMRKAAFAQDGITTYPVSAYDINGAWDTTRYTNWYETLSGRTSSRMNSQLSVSGGNELTQFLISGTFLKQKPSFPKAYDFSYQRTSVHTNLNHRSENKKFSANLTINYSTDFNNAPGEDPNSLAMIRPPNSPQMYNEDGSLHWETGFNNPLAIFNKTYESNTKALNATMSLNYDFGHGITFSSRFGYNDYNVYEYFTSPHTIYAPSPDIGAERSSAYDNKGNRNSWIIEPQLNWKKEIGKGTLDVLVGTTFQKSTSKKESAYGSNFPSDALIYDMRSAVTYRIRSSENVLYKYNAVFGRINYNWDRRYIVNMTGRRDGSSRFGPGKQFANFGAIGAAWILSEENFMKNITFLSFAKLRGSIGLTGNDQIGDYQFLNTYSAADRYGSVTGMKPTKHYNPDFSWETNKKTELALELGFFNDRLMIATSFYKNKSSNQLVGLPIPVMTGFETVLANLDAVVENKGIEVEINTVNIKTKDFSWTTAFNFSRPRNKLVSYPGLQSSAYANTYKVGMPLSVSRVFTYTGIDPVTGVYTFEDVNKDGFLTHNDDRKKWLYVGLNYSAGMNNTITYKRLHLDVFFQYVNKTATNFFYNRGATGGMFGNVSRDLLDNWTYNKENPKFQRLTTGANTQAITANSNIGYSDVSISDASFFRLKNVQLAYDIPEKLLGIRGSIYVQGQNLLTFTKFPGSDPENALSSYMAPLKVWNFGMQITF